MHRTNRFYAAALRTVLLGLACAVAYAGPASAQGQPDLKRLTGSAIIVPVNSSQRLQMGTGKNLKEVRNPKEAVARVQAIPGDPKQVLITGLEPGTTRITLIDVDNAEETYDIVVQLDVEYLRTLLRRAVPTANVEPIPGANNTVILTGVVAHAEDVETLLRASASVLGSQDRVASAMRVGGVQQVQLDVIVATVSRREIRRLSFEFANFGSHHILSNGFGGLTLPTTGISGTFPGGPIITNSVGQINGAPINVFAAVFTPQQDVFGLLQALRDENLVKQLAEPKLVTKSGKPASFLSGGEQAVPVPAGLGQIGIQFEEFGTRLNFLPIVLGNGRIHLEVEPEVSTLDQNFGTTIGGTMVPGRVTQRVHTTVELESGQTLAIGGLIFHTLTGGMRKVPILGDLPFIGAAFSSKSFDESESELLVLVTPRLVDAMSCDQAPKILPGQETRSPDDFELFLEGILEAPRGQRAICPGNRYVPAYKNGPSAGIFPCGGSYMVGKGSGCATCGSSAPAAVLTTAAGPQPTAPTTVTPPAPLLPAGGTTPVEAPVSDNKEPAVLPQVPVLPAGGKGND